MPPPPQLSLSPARRAARARLIRLRRIQRARGLRRVDRKEHRRHPLLVVAAALILLSMGGVYGGVQVGFALLDGSLGQLPDKHTFAIDSLVFDRAGNLIAELHPPGDTRLPVSYDRFAPALIQATVAIEDRNFWTEGATNPARMAVAAVNDFQHGNAGQGASTITQQLAKVDYLDDSKALSRKIRELAIARRLDLTLSKQEILAGYLNDIYYGQGATGAEAAARVYFAVDVHDLTLGEAAMLAGLPNQPTGLDPLTHFDNAKARQLEVLQAMVTSGYITTQQEQAAYAEKLPIQSTSFDNVNLYPEFTQRVVEEVQSQLHVDPLTAGLHIYTTLDEAKQQLAQQTVTDNVNRVAALHVTDGAMVSIDPSSGEVLAYVGGAGAGHPGYEIDMAASPRQPGSTFKLFTYTTAIGERVMTMTSPILDGPYTLPTGGGPFGLSPYPIANYDLRYHGVLPAALDLGNSFNIPAVKVELLAGIPNVVRLARTLGVTTLQQPETSYGASLTLGGYAVPLWEMAQAATVFAANGVLHPAHFVTDVIDWNGHHRWPGPPKSTQVVDPGLAFIMNSILSDDRNRLLEFGGGGDLTLPGHTVSAKTGTSQDFRDNLTVGWTPHLATAVWVGNTDNTPMQGTTGITGAAPAWHHYMDVSLRGVPDNWPAMPSDVHQGYGFQNHIGYYLDGTGPQGPAVGPCAPTQSQNYGNYAPPSPVTLPGGGTVDAHSFGSVPVACPLMTGVYNPYAYLSVPQVPNPGMPSPPPVGSPPPKKHHH